VLGVVISKTSLVKTHRLVWTSARSNPDRGIALRFVACEYTRRCQSASWLSFDTKWREDGSVVQSFAGHLTEQRRDDRNVGGHPTKLSAVVKRVSAHAEQL